MFCIDQLTKLYANKVVFSKYTNQLKANRLLLAGPNGAGKSTLLSILAGLETYQSGSIACNEQLMDQASLQKTVAIASDKLVFPDFLTAQQVMDLTKKHRLCCDEAPLVNKFNFSPYLDTQVANLSSGNLKKLQLINALMCQASVLLLDEPNATLEHNSLPVLLNLISGFEGQVIVTSHEAEPFTKTGFVVQALAHE